VETDAYLSFTPSTATPAVDRTKAVINFWFKLAEPEAGSARYCQMFSAGAVQGSGTVWYGISYDARTGTLTTGNAYGASAGRTTDAVFRDYGAWYNLHLIVDTTESATADKIKLYINGVLQTMTGSHAPSAPLHIGDDEPHRFSWQTSVYHTTSFGLQMYIANAYLLENSTLTYDTFAEEDATTGQLIPKATSELTFGTNGFHLDFKDSSVIGNDVSGNGNDFSDSGLAPADIVEDNPSAGMNYCVYNAAFSGASGLSEGNLKCTTTARGTFDAMSFASYWEIEANTISVSAGVISEGGTANTVAVTNGSTLGFRLSAVGALEYTSNGSIWTSIATGLSGVQFPYVTGGTTTANFGQATLSYDVPSGYAVLSTAGMTATIAKPAENFDVLTYSGDGEQTFDNGTTTMKPDLVWVKSRGSAYDHKLTDSVRGVTKALSCNDAVVEDTDSTGLTDFDDDGFTVGANTNYSDTTGDGMVAWNWKAGTTPAGTHTYKLSLALTDASGDGWDDGMLFATPILNVYEDRGSGNVLLGTATVTYEQEGAANYIINTNNKDAIEIIWDYDPSDSGANAGSPSDPAGTLKNGATTMATWLAGDPDVTDGAYFIEKTAGQTATGTGTLEEGDGSGESYNAAAGFSIIKWSGDGSGSGSSQEVNHSLNVAPELIIAKNRTDIESYGYNDWVVYHKSLGSGDYDMGELIVLNSDDAAYSPEVYPAISGVSDALVVFDNDDMARGGATYHFLNYMNSSDVGEKYIAYLFASVAGYSKVGSFSGSSTVFIYTGFRPSLIICKRSDSTGNWLMFDDQREGYNVDNDDLMANSTAVEATTDHIDILSNGFRIRDSDSDLNTGTVIFYAVGQSLKYASAR
jgi:hypothetical protein